MTDIVERLQRAMHDESALHSPRTTGAIEAMRAAQDEIGRLESDNWKAMDAAGEKIRKLEAALYKIVERDHFDDATIARKALGLPTTDRDALEPKP